MGLIVATAVGRGFPLQLTAGQRIEIRVLDAEGVVVQAVCDDTVPPGKSFSGTVSYGGTLS
jgi:hypothetical protein